MVSSTVVEISCKCLVVWLAHYIKVTLLICNEPGLEKQMLGSKVVPVGAKAEVLKKALTLVRQRGPPLEPPGWLRNSL